jgi:GxxExxY protein
MPENLIFRREAYAINGACMEVYRTMGNGFLEAVYQECLDLEFKKRGIAFAAQTALSLSYHGQTLKQIYRPDFICFEKIIVEIKAITKLTDEHRAQVINYLKATGFKLGILYNFGHFPLLEIARIANQRDLQR